MRAIGNIASLVLITVLFTLALSHILGVKFFSVISGSMEPEVPAGSLVITAPESLAGKAQVGDVISYVADKNLTVVTHRVVAHDHANGTYTTQGDANETSDPPVLHDNVVGKVALVIPVVGIPFSYLSTTSGKIIVLTVLVTLFLTVTLVSLLHKKKPKRTLVIHYEDESDLNHETFSRIEHELKKRGEKS